MEKQPYINRKLFDFIEVLRDADIVISADEVLSLFTALPEIDIADKVSFRQALKTTLVKDYTDIPVFDKCFNEFFSGREKLFDNIDVSAVASLIANSNPHLIEELNDLLDQFLDSLGDLVMERSSEELLNMFLEELLPSSSGGAGGMSIFKSNNSIASSFQSMAEEDGQENLRQGIDELLRGMLSLKKTKRSIGKELKNREDYLLNRYIYQLTPDEIKEMRELVKRFGQKLKNRISLRKKRVKHGGIDIKRTFRTNLQYGGVPFKLFYKNKKIDRPQLVIMCDVSRSVNQYSRFMLLLTYSLQSLFSKVRTFAFISNMVEITDLFKIGRAHV
jgi:uncharacterized protein with von Willebrand factor type A (vWA) domain